MKKQPKMVLVRWRDAVHEFGWIDDDSKDKDGEDMCISVGFLLKSNTKLVKLAMTLGEGDDEVAQTLQIPRGMIEDVRELG